MNNFEQIIQVNAINSNETSKETCLEEIISNVEFDDMLMIKLLKQALYSSYNNNNMTTLENWLFLEKIDN
ncbi:31778_t:CDS:1, partial [Gigaspora margarita]